VEIEIHSEYITLAQFLKISDLVGSGGETKAFLAEESVFVNDDAESRRGRKLYPGDVVRVRDRTVHIRKGVK
jgi:ribosome-associated protein